MLCALIVHGTEVFPQPLRRLSPWFEGRVCDADEVIANLEAQTHRRIIKTHVPLPMLPYHLEVSYVYGGRDPRDAFLSMWEHLSHLSAAGKALITNATQSARLFGEGMQPDRLFPLWLYRGEAAWLRDGFPFGSVLSNAQLSWPWRIRSNVLFVHFRNLSEDLPGQFERLARFLGTPIPSAQRELLVRHATLPAMRARSHEIAPDVEVGLWARSEQFFVAGRLRQWEQALSARNRELYAHRAPQLIDDDARHWLESGESRTPDFSHP
jgi:aryl sulfotransferase